MLRFFNGPAVKVARWHLHASCGNGSPMFRPPGCCIPILPRMSCSHLRRSGAQVDKARSWFNRAVLLNPDVGDFWALFYKFEAQHGGAEAAAEVAKRCAAAEPRHGERWQRVAKAPASAHMPLDAILKQVVADLDKEPPP